MVIASIRPSTLDGVKQLAKKIRREQNITHTQALEAASRQAGYENFVHAKRQLGAGPASGHSIFLSVHWQTPRSRDGEPRLAGRRAGREILRLELARPLSAVVAKHRVSRGRGLHGFRMEYEDHLEHRTNVQGQEAARKILLTAARALRVMDATGLQPVSTQKFHGLQRDLDRIPYRDHESHWFDTATGSYVFLDEPYAAAIENRRKERALWLDDRSWHMVVPDWEGIYYPGECVPHLVSPDGHLLKRLEEALVKIQPLEDTAAWPHETGLCGDDFVSPKREADAKPRRPRPGPSWGGAQRGYTLWWSSGYTFAVASH